MLEKIRSHPCITSLVIFILYVAWFFAPLLFVDLDPNRHGLSRIVEAIGQWKNQILLTIILTTVFSLPGWWKKIGFTPPRNLGGLKFLIVPVMLFHCLWDFCLFNMGALNAAPEGDSTASPLVTWTFSVVPACLYGSFVYWRWSVYREKIEQDRNLQPALSTL